MNPQERDSRLAAAAATARQLLVRAIDVRFGLDEFAEGIGEGSDPRPQDLRLLRADADALRREIDLLGELLWPSAPMESEEKAEPCAWTYRPPSY